jgi:hypothetical protein
VQDYIVGVVVELEGVGDMMVQGEIVEYIVVVEHMLGHMKEVVVVEVALVEFRRRQQLNFCDHKLEFQHHRKDLEGIEVEWWLTLNKRSNVIDNLDHDIHHSNYFFGKSLQLDEGVVVVELDHKNMMVVEEQVVLVEHIVVVEHILLVAVFVEVVVLVEFRRRQQLNFYDHKLEFQNQRRDLEGIEVEWWLTLNKRSSVIDNLDHDIHHSNYFFDKSLQLDEGVVVVELDHKNMMVVEEQVVLVEHIVVVEQRHMFVEVVELVVVVVEFHILGKFEFQFLVHILRF